MFYNKNIFKRCFNFPKRYWYKNIKSIPLYFRLMHDLVKHGYDEYATWETFDWFITTMRSILKRYRDNHYGYPADLDEETWDGIIDHMISLLNLMDDRNSKYDTEEYETGEGFKKQWAEMNAAKDEFFALFSKYFWNLWD